MEEDLQSNLIQRDTDISAQLTVDAYFHQDLQQLEGDIENYYSSSLVDNIVDSDNMDVDDVNDSSKPAQSVSISTPVGVKSDKKTKEKLGETEMVLDDGFVESQIDTKPKKPTITSLSQEESLLNEKVESMNNFLTREENLEESVRSGIIQAISIINLQRISIASQIEKLRAKKKRGKAKKVAVEEEIASNESEGEAYESDSGKGKKVEGNATSHAIETRWMDSLTDEEKATYKSTAREHINQFEQKKAPIPWPIRRLLKFVPEVLPECSYISKELAIHILTNREKRNACIFHSLKSAGRQICCDGNGKFSVQGVPFQKASIEENGAKGSLSCGCTIDEALLEFMFFKTATASSFNPRITHSETLQGDILHSRHRTFIAQAFGRATGIRVDDLYVGGDGSTFGTPEHMLKLVGKILEKVNSQLPEDRVVGLQLIDILAGDGEGASSK
ncbi:hypothetical protein DFH07DRAFT_952732 [Mycena maculata]|uniref:Uncharacterized protein n=1 Tax=Mycena maculata TaxID=230809 RepID=A0AAD7JZC5_9AGAR|nr:hypothetical protein DFH07DRAFT_952732 [Mycena maculata]